MGSPTPREAPVRLAVSPTLAEFALPGPLVEFGRHYERHVPVELTVVNSLLARELVRDGRVELGLAAVDPYGNEPGLCETPLCDDEIVVAVPRAHPWCKLEEIERAEFVSTPMIMRDPRSRTSSSVACVGCASRAGSCSSTAAAGVEVAGGVVSAAVYVTDGTREYADGLPRTAGAEPIRCRERPLTRRLRPGPRRDGVWTGRTGKICARLCRERGAAEATGDEAAVAPRVARVLVLAPEPRPATCVRNTTNRPTTGA